MILLIWWSWISTVGHPYLWVWNPFIWVSLVASEDLPDVIRSYFWFMPATSMLSIVLDTFNSILDAFWGGWKGTNHLWRAGASLRWIIMMLHCPLYLIIHKLWYTQGVLEQILYEYWGPNELQINSRVDINISPQSIQVYVNSY